MSKHIILFMKSKTLSSSKRVFNAFLIISVLFTTLFTSIVESQAAGFAVSLTTNPSTLAVNADNTLRLSVSGSALNRGIIDFEIFNESNSRVWQKYLENQNISTGETKNFDFVWKPTNIGKYKVKVGVFGEYWNPNLAWFDNVKEITVQAPAPQPAPTTTSNVVTSPTSQNISVWWPTNNSVLNGTQPFKAVLDGRSVNSYEMYWQVDGGGLNHMSTNYTDGPHKETLVNVGSWTWRGSGPYKVNFVAKMNGAVVAQKLISISTGNSQPVPATVVTTQPASVPTQAVSAPSTSGLYVNPLSPTLAQAREWQSSRPTDAALMLKIGNEPSARWFGGWNSNIYQDVKSYVDTAASANATPVLVAYNIPQRDCGGYSAGGSGSADSYKAWIGNMANGIGNRNAIVVLEPDATALTDCLSGTDLETRYQLLNFAVNTLEAKPGVKVYIDAGHPGWINSSEMANRLRQAGVSNAAGFSLNVSNFYTTPQNASYGQEVSRLINNKHFVIDTARNGLGGNGEWCNPSGRALGNKPTLNTGNSVIDGFLWIKTPGESDGNCNGGPGAGQWWGDYALGLAERASW